jgi:hypothetical protein
MYQHSNGSSTLPRGFRYHEPTTPEPQNNELRQPSPPRPRLKVRRRNVSNFSAPTEHFLASVAAADTPIPTIEVGQVSQVDSEMPDRDEVTINTSGLMAPQFYDYNFASPSPPRTPQPVLSLITGPSNRPDWGMGSPSPAEDYFSRPSSSMSNASDFSDDSFYSGSRGTRPSEDGSCTSPESESDDPFVFPLVEAKGKGKQAEEGHPLNQDLRSKTRKNAHWTKAQVEHLWSIYLLYLQDPTVTPFRLGASCVPPEGVCHRVAREARRSWKGGPRTPKEEKSGSNTPTMEGPKSYAAWPHSSSTTRSQLRKLCRQDNSSVSRHRHLQTRSPTPFTKPYRDRLRTPEPAFSTTDIAVSLATSTAESMQPEGPLAKLFNGVTETTPTSLPKAHQFVSHLGLKSRSHDQLVGGPRATKRLGSPFMAQTYGPSSSRSFGAAPTTPKPRPDTVGAATGPQLRSPLRFKACPTPVGLNTKRRAQNDLEDEDAGAIVRPRILDAQLFGSPFKGRRVRSRGFSLGDEALRSRALATTELFPPHAPSKHCPSRPAQSQLQTPTLLPAPDFGSLPPRLRSPFEEGPNNTFPRRLFHQDVGTVAKGWATMHQTRKSIESFDFLSGREEGGPSLRSRLERLEGRLRVIREREGRKSPAL